MQKVDGNRFVFNERLNAAFLDELFEGDTIYAETVFEDFLKDLPTYWQKVETSYQSKNMTALKTSIHTCKTLFGYVGFTDLQDLCQAFETKCSDMTGDLAADFSILSDKKLNAQHIIENEYNRLKKYNEST